MIVNDRESKPKQNPPIVIGAILVAIGYLALILILPAANVFYQAFKGGLSGFFTSVNNPEFFSSLALTLLIAIIVVPINVVFGLCAAWAIARHQFPGRTLLLSILDVPFSISPVVAGLMMILLYGDRGWFGGILQAVGIKVIFSVPGMVLATAFVTLPFVAREVIPVLEEIGMDQEEAARTLGASDWQIFWRVTLPNIRWGLLYGVILTNARSRVNSARYRWCREISPVKLKLCPCLWKMLISSIKLKRLFQRRFYSPVWGL